MIFSNLVASISELKKNPIHVMHEAKGEPVAILNNNIPAFYCISPDLFELLIERLEDEELVDLILKRSNEKEIEVSIDDL